MSGFAAFAPPKDSWQCKGCLVYNGNDLAACRSCEAANPNKKAAAPAPAPAPGGLFAKFAPAEGSWQCKSCLIHNAADAVVCKACETAKPGAGGAASSASAGPFKGFQWGGSAATPAPAASANPFQSAGVKQGGAVGFQVPTTTSGSTGGGFVFGGASTTGGFAFGGANGSSAPKGFAFDGFGDSKADAQPAAGAAPGAASGAAPKLGDAALSKYFSVPADAPAPTAAGFNLVEQQVLYPVSSSHVDGTVYVFGSNDVEQLGLGPNPPEATLPTPIAMLRRKQVCRIAAGGMHNAAVTRDGQLYTWGCNDEAALGREGAENMPRQVTGLQGENVTAVDAGDSHMVVLTESGKVFAWGTYKGKEGSIGFEMGVKQQRVPRRIAALEGYGRVVRISSGADHTMVVTAAGIVLGWGDGEQGQLGRKVLTAQLRGSRTVGTLLTPHVVHIGTGRRSVRVKNVFCGSLHSFVLDTDDQVWASGLNNYGQLGLGDNVSRQEFTKVEAFSGKQIIMMKGALHHTVALSAAGEVYAFGRGDSGQLGVTKKEAPVAACSHVPLRLPASYFGGAAVKYISCGASHSLAITADNNLYTWGYGDMFQLGNDEDHDERVPFHVKNERLEGQVLLQAGGGGQHSIVLATSMVSSTPMATAEDMARVAVDASAVPPSPFTPTQPTKRKAESAVARLVSDESSRGSRRRL